MSNTGNKNTGNWNTGNWNTGDKNTGSRNTGNWNTGHCNTGHCNTGHCNTGDRNTGDYNTGYRNTGNWNTVNKETGFFNTQETKFIRVFNKNCELEVWHKAIKPPFLFFNTTQWISEDDMTDDEKSANKSHETTGGYLKEYEYKEAFRKSYNEASEEDKALLLKLPNFDADVFFEISGIDVREKDNTEQIKALEDKIKELQAEVEKLK